MLALLRNPWILLGAFVVMLALFASGVKVGTSYARGQAAREEILIAKAGDAAAIRAAEAISKIKVVNQTNRTRIEREIVKVPALTTCHAGDAVRGVLDDALSGKARPEPAPDSVVPGAVPAR